MFKYTKDVIINSLLVDQDAYGSTLTTDKVQAEPGVLHILREGEYKFKNIVDGRIYKTPGYVGKTASLELNVSNGAGTIFRDLGVYRLDISIGMRNKYLSDYARANWYEFGKAILVEFEVTVANNNVTDLNTLIKNTIETAINRNNRFARATIVNGKVRVDLTDAYAHIENVKLEWYNPTSCDSCLGNFETFIIPAANLVIEQNTEPFGTGKWIQENLRFPSEPNRRYAGLYADETPIIGAVYTQYSLAMEVERTELGGLSGVGQKVTSITRHVYYVLNSLVDQFEEKINEAFGDNVIVEDNTIIIISAPTIAADGIPVRLVADTYPIDDTATITWSSPNLPTGVTLIGSVLTADPNDANVGDTFTIIATSSNSAYAPVSREFEVIAG